MMEINKYISFQALHDPRGIFSIFNQLLRTYKEEEECGKNVRKCEKW
jgi:hypothetical protein